MYYSKIIEYFENLAKSHEAFLHDQGGRETFVASDIDDFKRSELFLNNDSAIMIADYEPTGIGRAISSYIINETTKHQQTLRFNLAIFKAAEINETGNTAKTLDELYVLAYDIINIILTNRFENCYYVDLFKHMNEEILISRTGAIGNSRHIGLVLSFNFNFFI
jgi:hypothetical protein